MSNHSKVNIGESVSLFFTREEIDFVYTEIARFGFKKNADGLKEFVMDCCQYPSDYDMKENSSEKILNYIKENPEVVQAVLQRGLGSLGKILSGKFK
jgi:hypothetical protein